MTAESDPGAVERHKAVVRRFVDEVRNRGNLDVIHELVVPELVEETRGMAGAIRAAFADYHVTIDALVGEGETVVLCATQRGVHRGTWQGLPATDRPVSWGVMRVFEFAGDKIAATHAYADLPALIAQLGGRIVPA